MKLSLPLKVFSLVTILFYLTALVQCAHNETTTTPRAVLITVSNSTAKPSHNEHLTNTSPKSVSTTESEINKSSENVNDNDDEASLTTTESTVAKVATDINNENNGTITGDSNGDKEVESEGSDGERNEESEEPSEEGAAEEGNDNDRGEEGNDRPEGGGSEEEEPEDGETETEDRCTFNQFLSGLNISHYLPSDRGSLRDEYDTFEDVPDRIRHSPSVNYTIQRLKRLLNLANGITSRQELRSGFASFIQHNYELFLELELDAACMTSIISIIAAMRRSELWAIKCKCVFERNNFTNL